MERDKKKSSIPKKHHPWRVAFRPKTLADAKAARARKQKEQNGDL